MPDASIQETSAADRVFLKMLGEAVRITRRAEPLTSEEIEVLQRLDKAARRPIAKVDEEGMP
jgi:hypothetical protein